MKNLINIIIVLFSFSFMFSSCGKSEDKACKSVTCSNGGKCNDGTCECPAGYEGHYCERLSAEKFVGLYEGKFVTRGQAGDQDYTTTVIVNKTAVDNIIYLSESRNYFYEFKDIICEIYDKNKLKVVAGKKYRGHMGTEDVSIEGTGTIDELGRDLTLTINMKRISTDPNESDWSIPYTLTITLRKM